MSRRTSGLVRCFLFVFVMLFGSLMPAMVQSETLSNPDFNATWAREDAPVAAGQANRSWLWGPEPFTTELREPYDSAAEGLRTVQYFDKARMEINDPDAERDRWFVTTGLLATELMTGARQVSDNGFEQRGPALIPVAGDSTSIEGPTYASFNHVRGAEPFNTGATITATIDRGGHVGSDQHFARYAVFAERYVPATDHSVASVFWEFLNTTGTVQNGGVYEPGRLFEPWFYVTGLPVTEAYWANVLVGGVPRDVLTQVFERRVLTYTPSNDPAWRVELGNVGRHYYSWRYESATRLPVASDEQPLNVDLAGIPPARAEDGSWEMGWDAASESYRVANVANLNDSALRTVSRYWDIPEEQSSAYRVTAEVRAQGSGEAGIGVRAALDEGTIASMLYLGVTADGVRTFTFEDNTNGTTHYLLPPAGGLPGWDAAPNAWNTLALTVVDDHAWIEIGGEIAGEVELPAITHPSGAVALNVTAIGTRDVAAVWEFRNLTIEPVEAP